MAKYQVAIITRPENWTPECADDVPLELIGPVGVLTESDDLFEAVSRAMEHNESAEARRRGRWAVVVEPAQHRPHLARRPAVYAHHLQSDRHLVARRLGTRLAAWTCPTAFGKRRARRAANGSAIPRPKPPCWRLNRQCMEHPGTTWHVVVAVENESISRTDLLRSRRHRNDGRSPPHARHSARAGRTRRLRPLPCPRLPMRQGRLVEPAPNGHGPPQPGLRRGRRDGPVAGDSRRRLNAAGKHGGVAVVCWRGSCMLGWQLYCRPRFQSHRPSGRGLG